MKNKTKTVLQFLLFVALIFLHLPAELVGQISRTSAQSSRWQEAGAPYMRNFTYEDYHAHVQHWSIIQDKRGVMYLGANNGVHEFDGVSWRVIAMPNASIVRSVTRDHNCRIYVGAQDEFGYLAPDVRGEMQYVSLISQVPPQERSFGDIRSVVATNEGIFFQSHSHLFRLSGNLSITEKEQPELNIWHSRTKFLGAFAVQDRIYVQQQQAGLMTMTGDSLHVVPNGEKFADNRIYFILPFSAEPKTTVAPGAPADENIQAADEQTLLVATRKGLFLFDGRIFKRFYTEADTFIREQRLQHGAILSDGSLVLATERRGIAILDRQGRLQRILDKASGLRDVHVKFVYEDKRQGLWLALNGGVARYEIQQPLTLFQHTPGIENGVVAITRHKGRLYVATGLGIYYLQPAATPGAPPVFRPVSGITAQCTSLLSAGKFLFAGTSDGLYRIEGKRSAFILSESIACLYRSRRNPNRIYLGRNDGLGLLQIANGEVEFVGNFPGVTTSISNIAEDAAGALWLATRYRGLWRLPEPSLRDPLDKTRPGIGILRYGARNELPNGWISLLEVEQKILFGTTRGMRRFDPSSEVFLPDSTFGAVFADTACSIGELIEADQQGRYWTQRYYRNHNEIGLLSPRGNGNYSWQIGPLARAITFGPVFSIYPDAINEDVVWFAGGEGIVRYDAAIVHKDSVDFSALVRRVTANDTTAIFGGTSSDQNLRTDSDQTARMPLLPYTQNNLRFEYACPFYEGQAENRFQYFLQGFDRDWSAWTRETRKDYTNLREGQYSFRVRAKNIYGNISGEAIFEFTILPPWYRAWWAYVFYVFCFGLTLYSVRRIEMKRVQDKYKLELEQVEYAKLKDLDQMKSQFFANISHEFRTPLTLILGPAEELISLATEPKAKQKLGLIHRNATRLLRLINQLLDLSKLETGKMQLQTSPGDFVAFLKGLTMSFESLADGKNIDLRFQVKDAPATLNTPLLATQPCEPRIGLDSQGFAEVHFDRDKIEKIFANLLSNAFKFTPDGGSVKVSGTLIADYRLVMSNSGNGQKYEFRNPKCETCINNLGAQGATPSVNCVEIRVEDTGHGIPADRLLHIFDRFYQVDTSSTRAHEGTGIGLALVKELVEVHNGNIEVQSREGHGTIFTVCLPLGNEHLQVDEIAESNIGASLQGTELKHAAEFIEEPEGSGPLSGEEQNGSVDDTIVLIIEDNADVRAYIRDHLESDYKIIEAKDGAEGIDKAVETIPDLIISDVMMPKKNGYEVCQVLKTDERTSHIPVILLTAKAAEDEKVAGLETGADAYMLKPFRSKELAVRVRKLIELRRKLRQRFSATTVIKPSEIDATSMDQVFLQQVIAAAEKHLDDEQFGLVQLANAVRMSASQLHRKLRALINQSPGQLLRSMRLQRGADLIKQQAGTVVEIAYQVGFGSQAHFTKMFHKQFGCTPTEYQKRS